MCGWYRIHVEYKFTASSDGGVTADGSGAQQGGSVVDRDVAATCAAIDIQLGSAVHRDAARTRAAIDIQIGSAIDGNVSRARATID